MLKLRFSTFSQVPEASLFPPRGQGWGLDCITLQALSTLSPYSPMIIRGHAVHSIVGDFESSVMAGTPRSLLQAHSCCQAVAVALCSAEMLSHVVPPTANFLSPSALSNKACPKHTVQNCIPRSPSPALPVPLALLYLLLFFLSPPSKLCNSLC